MKLTLKRIGPESAGQLHEMLAEPSISPFALIGHEGKVNLAPFLADGRNIALLTLDGEKAEGAILFHWQEPGVYEVHTMAREGARGLAYMRAVTEALRTMFLCSDCMELYTRIPEGNLRALGLVRFVQGRREFLASDNKTEFYALRWPQWLWGRGGESLVERGKRFHERLEAQFAEQDRVHEAHEDNSDHDRMVGATTELILNGMVVKGITLYNRWAKLAGYAVLNVVVQNPLVLNIGDALIQVDLTKRDFYLLAASPESLRAPLLIERNEFDHEQRVMH